MSIPFPLQHTPSEASHPRVQYSLLRPGKREREREHPPPRGTCSTQTKFKAQVGIVWVEPMATIKLTDYPYSYIKGNSVLKACWTYLWYMNMTLYARENII